MVHLFVGQNLHGTEIHDQKLMKIYGDEVVQIIQIQIDNDHVQSDIMYHILRNG